jgi:hypothetical protein
VAEFVRDHILHDIRQGERRYGAVPDGDNGPAFPEGRIRDEISAKNDENGPRKLLQASRHRAALRAVHDVIAERFDVLVRDSAQRRERVIPESLGLANRPDSPVTRRRDDSEAGNNRPAQLARGVARAPAASMAARNPAATLA